MNIIDRYVYAVTKQLPDVQKEDIEKELRTLIDDLLTEHSKGQTASDNEVEAVLQELGDPVLLADKYREKKRYLIGPENFDRYIYILKIVLKVSALGIVIASLVSFATEPVKVGEALGTLISNAVDACFSAFGWVTGIFAVLELRGVNLNERMRKEKGEWTSKDLPEIPEKKAMIRPSGPIIGIIFGVLAIVIFNYSPEIFGIYILGKGGPIFNLEFIKNSILLLDIVFCVGILKKFFELWIGKYTIKLAAITTVLNVAAFALSMMLITNPNLWNIDFLNILSSMPNVHLPFAAEALSPLASMTKLFVVILAFSYALDTVVVTLKALKYRR